VKTGGEESSTEDDTWREIDWGRPFALVAASLPGGKARLAACKGQGSSYKGKRPYVAKGEVGKVRITKGYLGSAEGAGERGLE